MAENQTHAENSIRPSQRSKGRSDPLQTSAADQSAKAQEKRTSQRKPAPPLAVPEEIRQRFVQVKNKYYFADGARAFTDRGNRLTTPSENTEVVRSLVAIAQARGWSDITVRGTERFRKEAWFAARLAGLDVRGYKPSEFEQGHLVRTIARQGEPSPEADGARAPAGSKSPVEANALRERRGGLLTGKLLDHGPAPYQQDPHQPMSYFVKVETPRGDRTIWGIDLERAFKEALTRPQRGDEVGLRAVRREAVTVKAAERDEAGKLLREKDLATHRNHWIVEKRDFFDARAAAARTLRDTAVDPKQAVKKHPELVGTYLQVHAAKLAARSFRDPEEQHKFVAQVRSALADSVARGEPLPPVRLKDRTEEHIKRTPPKETTTREATLVRG